jgi:putative endonuclease
VYSPRYGRRPRPDVSIRKVVLRWGRGAVGSVPVTPGRSRVGILGSEFVIGGAVAQLGARLDGIEEVVGSNPIGSTKVSKMYFVYILQSRSSARYYTGQTHDLDARLIYHNSNWSKSLRNRGPWELVYREEYATRSEALRRERQIKSWKDRDMIERLVSAFRSTSYAAS